MELLAQKSEPSTRDRNITYIHADVLHCPLLRLTRRHFVSENEHFLC